MSLSAGSSILDISPASPCHLAGYASRDHPHEGIHDRLSLRALYLTNGSEEVALVSADILWFHEEVAQPIHDLIQDQLDIPPERVMLCGTHTHSAPTTSSPDANSEYLHFLASQTLAALTLAKTRAEPVSIRVARGSSHVGVNRREQKPGGEIVLGENPDGPIDREIILISLEGSSGKPVADICNFTTHGTVMGGDNYLISGDWCGIAASAIETESDSAFLFLNGGAANVNPRGRTRPSGFQVAESLAKEFAKDMASKQCDVEGGMGRTRRIRIHGIRIGPIRIVGFPGEVFSETAMAVKKATAPRVVAVNSYTSGGAAGYVLFREAYDTGGYEVRVSPYYSEDAEDILRSKFINLLGDLD